jgi:ParB-like chromosome segregation protein Spo0J
MSRSQREAGRLEQRPVAELQPHPHAAEVPPLGENECEALRADVDARGVLAPIEVTAGGVVLDGRARLRAARELGHETVEVKVVTPRNELEHILRAALQRRHLDPSQRAALALKIVPFEDLRAQAQERQQANLRQGADVATLPARDEPTPRGRTRDLVAEIAGTSARTAQDVITVHEHDPELYEQILRGERKANAAASEIRQTLRDAELAAAAPPLLEGPFELVYADPPWRLPGSPTSSRAVVNHYPTMPLEEIKAIRIPAAESSLLFLWGVNSMTPEALRADRRLGVQLPDQLRLVQGQVGARPVQPLPARVAPPRPPGQVRTPADDAASKQRHRRQARAPLREAGQCLRADRGDVPALE